MTGSVKVGVAIAASILSLLATGTALWLNRPFQAELGSYRTSLADRTDAQRHNIRQAAMDLDGRVIEPGGTFSFNYVVGPRTPERGYREAPAFMERDLVRSIGGGICQVSSTVYNAAIVAGMAIVERHPHFRRVTSVSPGRDATVWYETADLKFKNIYHHPVQLSTRISNDTLSISLRGGKSQRITIHIHSNQMASSGSGSVRYMTVRTIIYSDRRIVREIISIDSYH